MNMYMFKQIVEEEIKYFTSNEPFAILVYRVMQQTRKSLKACPQMMVSTTWVGN